MSSAKRGSYGDTISVEEKEEDARGDTTTQSRRPRRHISLTSTQPSANEPTNPTTVMLGCKATEGDDDLNYASGLHAYPPLLSLRLQAGALKFNMCDTSIVLFLRYIEYAL
jgi:hypothetical protein